MTQPELFPLGEVTDPPVMDLTEAQKLMQKGLDAATAARPELVALMKAVARDIGRKQVLVTADDVWLELAIHGVIPEMLGNAAGAMFRSDDWECVGNRKSERVTNHGRRILVWSYAHRVVES